MKAKRTALLLIAIVALSLSACVEPTPTRWAAQTLPALYPTTTPAPLTTEDRLKLLAPTYTAYWKATPTATLVSISIEYYLKVLLPTYTAHRFTGVSTPSVMEFYLTQIAPTSLCPDGCIAPSSDCKIKGDITLDGKKIYYVPGHLLYGQTRINPEDGERWFCTEEEARANGWRKSLQ